MNRVVAVKVLTATEDIGSFNRFKNEATAAGNLHHEHIVTVYEFGQEGDVPFLVMEYLNGQDLQKVIKGGTALTLYQKVRIMDQVADGLQCAHSEGVLHRDVKPGNVMLLKDGSIKIMDFGIARLMRDTSTRLTQQGYLIGTVVYMAPELFAGSEVDVDALCDIWSYGVVMSSFWPGTIPLPDGKPAIRAVSDYELPAAASASRHGESGVAGDHRQAAVAKTRTALPVARGYALRPAAGSQKSRKVRGRTAGVPRSKPAVSAAVG